jgi:hypothetical protein
VFSPRCFFPFTARQLFQQTVEKFICRLSEGSLAVIASQRRSNLALWLGINSAISLFIGLKNRDSRPSFKLAGAGLQEKLLAMTPRSFSNVSYRSISL